MINIRNEQETDYVSDYARAVYKGDIITSKKVKKQCEKHLKDLKRENFKFHYDVKKANRVIHFMEMLPNPKDGKPMKLARWQKFVVGSLFGWTDELNNRRYKRAYISVARKNSKSILTAGITLYEFLYGKNPKLGRQLYTTANSKDQARIVFNMVKKQLETIREQSPTIKNITKITPSRNEILNLKDDSIIRPLSKDTSSLDGFEPLVGVLDEYHESKDNKMIDVLRSGQILLNNPLTIIISTAGFNMGQAPMYEQYLYLSKVLNGEEENDTYFTFIAEQDDDKEIYDENMWVKSNPLLEVDELRPIMLQNLRDELQEGIQKQDLNAIKVKNFNMWQQASRDTYIAMGDWEECYTDSKLNIAGRDVYIGVDLSRSDDLTALGMIFPTDDKTYFVDSHVFVGTKKSIEEKSKTDKIDYMKLVETNMATLTNAQSGIINYEQVCEWLIDYIEDNQLNVKGIMYDPWNAQALVSKLENETDYTLIEVGQNYRNLSPALKQFKLDVFEKKILHNGNPNLNLAISNAIVKTDNNGNIILNKMLNRSKIDSIVALTTAYTIAMNHEFNNDYIDYVMSDDFGF